MKQEILELRKRIMGSMPYELNKVFHASVTFATVVVRFICLRFSLRFFGIVGGYKLRRMCLHCLRSPCDFFRRQTKTKSYRDLADIVQQPQCYRVIFKTSLYKSHDAHTMALWKSQGVGTLTAIVFNVHGFKRPSMFIFGCTFEPCFKVM